MCAVARIVVKSRAVRDYLDAFIVAGLCALFLITFVTRTFYIPSGSMIPTLVPRDVVLVDELAYRFHPPHDGDVAVFWPPAQAHSRDEFIKRVIGVPGDTIRISNGMVYRNGKALLETYENETPDYNLTIANYGIYVDTGDGVMKRLDRTAADIPPRSMWQAPDRIPRGFVFVLGDNRRYSLDSHAWGFAPLHGTFIGRAFFILWPFDRFGVLH